MQLDITIQVVEWSGGALVVHSVVVTLDAPNIRISDRTAVVVAVVRLISLIFLSTR